MNIKEWAKINNYTPEQFKEEITKTMAVIGAMEMDGRDDKRCDDIIGFTVVDSDYSYNVIVAIEPLKRESVK